MPTQLDFSALYDEHPEYIARRQSGSFEQAQIAIEVELFKLPNLLALLAPCFIFALRRTLTSCPSAL